LVHCLYGLIRPGTEGSGKREKRESAPARLRASGGVKTERARARARSFWAFLHIFKKGVTCIQRVTCIEQAWAPSLVSDGTGRPCAVRAIKFNRSIEEWVCMFITIGPMKKL